MYSRFEGTFRLTPKSQIMLYTEVGSGVVVTLVVAFMKKKVGSTRMNFGQTLQWAPQDSQLKHQL